MIKSIRLTVNTADAKAAIAASRLAMEEYKHIPPVSPKDMERINLIRAMLMPEPVIFSREWSYNTIDGVLTIKDIPLEDNHEQN